MLMVSLLLIVSCTGAKTESEPATDETPAAAQPANGAAGPGTVGETGEIISTTALSGEEQSRRAQELLRRGDVEGALTILEQMAATEPMSDDLGRMLLEAHTRYVHTIAMSRGVTPEELNRVLYSHYVRILELDPENAEAQAGLNSVRVWFEGHGMTLPETVDPLAFLPVEDEAETSDEVIEDASGEAVEDTGE